MRQIGRCIHIPNPQAPNPKFTLDHEEIRHVGYVELSVYFTENSVLGNTFEEYLDVHQKVLNLWDPDGKRYRNGMCVARTDELCVVYLQDLRIYVKWRRSASLITNVEVLIGRPVRRDQTWYIECFVPTESILNEIKKQWDIERKKFRSSVFLRKDGDRIWVYLEDLKICVGWIKGHGTLLFGGINSSKCTSEKLEDLLLPRMNYFGIELRRKICCSYGCW